MPAAVAMRPWRVRLVLLIAAVIVLGHAYDIITMREHWPFSNYPMYAKLIKRGKTFSYRLYGKVTDGTRVWEMPIVDGDVMYVAPLNEMRMKNILGTAWGTGGDKGKKATQEVLRDYMAMYESQRILNQQAVSPPGPRMLEAICKRVTWLVDDRGATMKHPHEERLVSATAFPPTTQPADDTVSPTTESAPQDEDPSP